MKITATTVATADPGPRLLYYWDDDLPGFGLRVSPSGVKAYVLRYRLGAGREARQRNITLGRHPVLKANAARAKAADILAKARLGQDGSEELKPKRKLTVGELIDKWSETGARFNRRTGKRRAERSVGFDLGALNAHVRPLIGQKPIDAISAATLNQLREDITAGKTAGTWKTKARGVRRVTGGEGAALNTLRVFRSVLAYAVEEGLLEANPASKLKLPQSNSRERFLSGDELARLGAALNQVEREGAHPSALAIIRLLVLTGLRKNEVAGLKWSEVDLERGALILTATKTGRSAFPLGRAAIELLETLPRCESPFVFPATSGEGFYQGTPKIWQRVRARAGLENVRLHDLRHTFASVGAQGGAGLTVVGKLLGHKQASTTARYSHLADDPLRAAADSISGAIAARMTGAKPKAV